MTTPAHAQVRRCAACRSPSAVLVEAWGPGASVRWAIDAAGAGSPPEPVHRGAFVCQACGARFDYRRFGGWQIAALAVATPAALFCGFGVVVALLQTLFARVPLADGLGQLFCLGLPMAALVTVVVRVGSRRLLHRRWPVLDAPRPEITRAAPSPALRRCRCGQAAPAERVEEERLKSFIPTGRRYVHACAACGATFSVHSAFGIAFALAVALFLTAIGALVTLHPPGQAVGAAEQNVWLGYVVLAFALAGWAVVVARLVARARHREIRPARF